MVPEVKNALRVVGFSRYGGHTDAVLRQSQTVAKGGGRLDRYVGPTCRTEASGASSPRVGLRPPGWSRSGDPLRDGARGNLILATIYMRQAFDRFVAPMYAVAKPETKKRLDEIIAKYPENPDFRRASGRLGIAWATFKVELMGMRVRRLRHEITHTLERCEPELLELSPSY